MNQNHPMKHRGIASTIFITLLLHGIVLAADKPNVLCIAVDDLCCESGCYGVDEDENLAVRIEDSGLLRQLSGQIWNALREPPGAQPAAVRPVVPTRERRIVAGWTVQVSKELLEKDATATALALELVKTQLEEIVRVVPKAAVAELQKVQLYFSPEYPGVKPRAEYHPDVGWLRENGRDPDMAKGVEFTNVRIFAAETRRMPNFALHELAHAYHDRALAGGFANPEIKAGYERARAGGAYERVERWHGDGRPNTFDRAYAMTDPMEYFAECTEAFFARNDFFPFTRDELKRHDPETFELLARLWGVEARQEGPKRKTAAALKQAPVDFNHPPRDYVTRELCGWSVLVEKQLVDESPEPAKAALARLERKLGEAASVLPVAALPDLRKLKNFLLYGPKATAGGRSNGLEYFRAGAPKYQDWLDPRMGRSIVIFNAANYAKLSESWALKALVHEFGHAQHLEHWPEDRAEIYDAWDHAMKAGLYQTVREEDKGTHTPNYAAQNHLEYFAELTAIYFVGADYFPKDRAGLEACDPDGYALVEKLWGISGDRSPPSSKEPKGPKP